MLKYQLFVCEVRGFILLHNSYTYFHIFPTCLHICKLYFRESLDKWSYWTYFLQLNFSLNIMFLSLFRLASHSFNYYLLSHYVNIYQYLLKDGLVDSFLFFLTLYTLTAFYFFAESILISVSVCRCTRAFLGLTPSTGMTRDNYIFLFCFFIIETILVFFYQFSWKNFAKLYY